MVNGEGPDTEKGTAVEATVIELLPNAVYRLELDSREQVIAHAAGPLESNFVRLRPRDKVLVELSPHDRTRGRVVQLLSGHGR